MVSDQLIPQFDSKVQHLHPHGPVQDFLGKFNLSFVKQRHITILHEVSGIIKPGRWLFGYLCLVAVFLHFSCLLPLLTIIFFLLPCLSSYPLSPPSPAYSSLSLPCLVWYTRSNVCHARKSALPTLPTRHRPICRNLANSTSLKSRRQFWLKFG